MFDELVRSARAMRTVEFSRAVVAFEIIDAVREVADSDYVERITFLNDRLAYVIGRRSRAPSQNIVITACDGSFTPDHLYATEAYKHVLVVNGGLDGRTLLGVEGPHLYYREVKAFAECVRRATEARIKDPTILNRRAEVALSPLHVKD